MLFQTVLTTYAYAYSSIRIRVLLAHGTRMRCSLISELHCSSDNQVFKIEIKQTRKEAKCASCKNTLSFGDPQASTEGPYRTFNLTLIKRTFYFCPQRECFTKLPRNSFIKPFQAGGDLIYDPEMTVEQKALIHIDSVVLEM